MPRLTGWAPSATTASPRNLTTAQACFNASGPEAQNKSAALEPQNHGHEITARGFCLPSLRDYEISCRPSPEKEGDCCGPIGESNFPPAR